VRSTRFLLYAALQFVVLTAIGMQLYPHYRFSGHFFSDLGATVTWHGENNAGAPLFVIALGTVGVAMILFAAQWRTYAFARKRGFMLGIATQVMGTLSGLGFIGVACTPVNVALDTHNTLVIVAFGLLLAFAILGTTLWWVNGAPTGVLVAGGLYVLVLIGFFAAAGWVVRAGLFEHVRVLIVAQKIVVYASMAYVVFLTMTILRAKLTR
jgi:hypothetical protein